MPIALSRIPGDNFLFAIFVQASDFKLKIFKTKETFNWSSFWRNDQRFTNAWPKGDLVKLIGNENLVIHELIEHRRRSLRALPVCQTVHPADPAARPTQIRML